MPTAERPAQTYAVRLRGGFGHETDEHETDFVQFRAPSVATAFRVAKNYCGERPAEFYENGHMLGALNYGPDDEF